MKYIFTLLFISYTSLISAQHFSGVVQLEDGKPLSGASVVIRNLHSKNIYSFSITNKNGNFSVSVPPISHDSLQLKCSFIGYTDMQFVVSEVMRDTPLLIVLKPQPKELPGVTLDAPPIWKRGDTTFYNVDKLKTGSEIKLAELIEQLPDFQLNEQQQLTYKGKLVEKILLDGQGLFEDKVKLMINSFPLQAVENIQVLENQTDNPKLKGLESGNKVFINLQLKKNRLKIGLGDGEAGLDSEGRYLVGATFFSLLNKLQIGYIGNFTEQGNGVDNAMEMELTSETENQLNQWLMYTPGLYQLQMFENRYYISNRLANNRFSVNYRFSQKVKSKSELNLVKDHQLQQTFNQLFLLNDTAFISRNENMQYRRLPSYLQAKQDISWEINNKSEMNFSFQYFKNATSGISNNTLSQENFSDTTVQQVDNRRHLYSLTGNFINRHSAKSAIRADVGFIYSDAGQDGIFRSSQLSEVFNVPSNNYRQLNVLNKNKMQQFYGGIQWLRKPNKRSEKFEIRGNLEQFQFESNALVSSVHSFSPDAEIPEIGGSGKYQKTDVWTGYNSSWNIKKWQMNIKANTGFTNVERNESGSLESKTFPTYSTSFNFINKVKFGTHNARIHIHNQPLPFVYYANLLLPFSVNSFRQFNGPFTFNNTIDAEYSISTRLKRHRFNASLYSQIRYSGEAAFYQTNKTVQFRFDTLIRQQTRIHIFNLNYSHASVPLQTNIRVFISALHYSNPIIIGNDVQRSFTNAFTGRITLKRNWNKKYYLEFIGKAMMRNNKIQGISNQPNNFITNYEAKLNQRLFINKRMSAWFQSSYYHNDVISGAPQKFFISDAGVQYNFKKPRIICKLALNNVTNITSFNYSVASPYYQNDFILPIIPRNLSVLLNYSF